MRSVNITVPAIVAMALSALPVRAEKRDEAGPLALKVEQVGTRAPVDRPVPLRVTIKSLGLAGVELPGFSWQMLPFCVEFEQPRGWTSNVRKGLWLARQASSPTLASPREIRYGEI